MCRQNICVLGYLPFFGYLYLFWSLDHYNILPIFFKSILGFALKVVKMLIGFISFFHLSPGKAGLRDKYIPVNFHYVYVQLI